MEFQTLLSMVFVTAALACSTTTVHKKEIHYHAYDCQNPDSNELGEYILKNTKPKRFVAFERDSCHQEYLEFLSKTPSERVQLEDRHPEKVAGMWTYDYYTRPNRIFSGPQEVLHVIEEGRTYNILIDKDNLVYVLELINLDTNRTTEKIVKASEISGDINKMKAFNGLRVHRCSNFLHYISSRVKEPFTITLTDSKRSNAEYRFNRLSGFGGFYKKK